MKENDLVHGEWGKWCESIGITQDLSRRYIRVFEEFNGGNHVTSRDLGLNALYEIAQLSPEQRIHPQTVPSTGETKTVDEMTVRELREVKKALKAAEQDKKRLERELDEAKNMDHYELIED
ncbi:hypothetical protein BA1_11984 [Bacillus xiamenensis]|nr:hypothetical protein BA1_11984 [Bacillus xiamenensis]